MREFPNSSLVVLYELASRVLIVLTILEWCLHKLDQGEVSSVLVEGQVVCQELFFPSLGKLTLTESANSAE